MKPYEQKPNTGSLFKNADKGPGRVVKTKAGEEFTVPDPDYRGTLLVAGAGEFWMDATIKTARSSGKQYLSVRINPKQARPPKGAVTEQNWGTANFDDAPF